MFSQLFEGGYSFPGMTAANESFENVFWADSWINNAVIPCAIDGSSSDSGNTPDTRLLRTGLLMGRVTSTKKYVPWTPFAADGSQRIAGVLMNVEDTLIAGTSTDKWTGLFYKGCLKHQNLYIAGNTDSGLTGDYAWLAIRQLLDSNRFIFIDEDYNYVKQNPILEFDALDGDDITLTAAAHAFRRIVVGDLTTSGGSGDTAITMTLPTCVPGLRFEFYNNFGDDLTVAAGSGNILRSTNVANAVLADVGDYLVLEGVRVTGTTYKWAVLQDIGCTYS